ncbi:MAG TPA: HAMP domain-containing protein [Actinocatenispora sp.]
MRRRLALLVAATTSLVLVAFLVPLALLVRTVAEDRAVNAATVRAQALTAVVATGSRATLAATVAQANNDPSHPVTVFLADRTVLGAPADRTDAVELALRGRSLSVDTDAGRQILVSVQGVSGAAAVVTLVPRTELHQGVTRAWLILLGLGCALVAVGVLVADRLARTLVRPIGGLSAVSHRLAAGDLDARASAAGPPEVREVAGALNHLADRIRVLLRQERENAADLSHRLRTPLTALRLDAETLRDADESARITADIDALARAVDRAITDARRPADARCDATAVVRERVAFWAVLAEETGRTVDLDLPDRPVPVALPAADLAAALDALLGNVFAHTPDGTGFAVGLSATRTGAWLVVADRGPGIRDPGMLARGASTAASTGLGLDIARRAAVRSGGDLTIAAADSGGASVILHLGAAGRPE